MILTISLKPINAQRGRFNATGREEPVDRSEVTSHVLSEAFINMQPLVHDGGGGRNGLEIPPTG